MQVRGPISYHLLNRFAVRLLFPTLSPYIVKGEADAEIVQTPVSSLCAWVTSFQYEIIEGRGYIANQYIVKTDDNYYLTLYRIRSRNTPANSSKKVVFLQHGLFDSAHTWINNLANQSLGFILADAGYDVFLGNSRGSTYSRGHAQLDPKYAKYWAFSYDEMVKFDLPTSINFVVKEAGLEKIFYVGHSQVSLSLTLLIFSYYLGEY